MNIHAFLLFLFSLFLINACNMAGSEKGKDSPEEVVQSKVQAIKAEFKESPNYALSSDDIQKLVSEGVITQEQAKKLKQFQND